MYDKRIGALGIRGRALMSDIPPLSKKEIGHSLAMTYGMLVRSTLWTRSRPADCFSGDGPLRHMCGTGTQLSQRRQASYLNVSL
eukprot:11591383-Heterocapsa_arctica.AAC.1